LRQKPGVDDGKKRDFLIGEDTIILWPLRDAYNYYRYLS